MTKLPVAFELTEASAAVAAGGAAAGEARASATSTLLERCEHLSADKGWRRQAHRAPVGHASASR